MEKKRLCRERCKAGTFVFIFSSDIDFRIDFWKHVWQTIGPKMSPNNFMQWVPFSTFFGVPTLGHILIDLGFPFGTLWFPWVPFGILLAPFWFFWAPLWAHWGPFCTCWAVSWAVLGFIPGFWRRNPQKHKEIHSGHQISYKCSLANFLP